MSARLQEPERSQLQNSFDSLRELLAEPQQADLLLEVRVVELLVEVVQHRLRAVAAERLVVLLVAAPAGAGDDEEEARPALVAPGLLDEHAGSRIQLGLPWIELHDARGALLAG